MVISILSSLKSYPVIVAQDLVLPDIKKQKNPSPKVRVASEIKNSPLKKQVSLQKFPIKNKKAINLKSMDHSPTRRSPSLSERSNVSTETTTNSNNSPYYYSIL